MTDDILKGLDRYYRTCCVCHNAVEIRAYKIPSIDKFKCFRCWKRERDTTETE